MSRRKRSDGTPERSSRRGTPERSPRRKRIGIGATEHDAQDEDIEIFALNDIDAGYRRNHHRRPDLSANIKVVFPTEEYVGAYLSHGQTKTVFVLRSSSLVVGSYTQVAAQLCWALCV